MTSVRHLPRWLVLGASALVAFTVANAGRRHLRRYRGPVREVPGPRNDELARGLASTVGVAPIDPQPITQLAGEGIDPDQDTSRPPPAADIVSRLPLRP